MRAEVGQGEAFIFSKKIRKEDNGAMFGTFDEGS